MGGTENRELALKILRVLVGLFFLVGVYALATSFRQADMWDGDKMMLSIYVTLGVFLLLAAVHPSANRSLIAFTAWSGFARGTVRTFMAFKNTHERTDPLTAGTVLYAIGAALIALEPAKRSTRHASEA